MNRISSAKTQFMRSNFSGRGQACGSRRRAFTLVELLVVISIIGVLLSVLIPALSQARQSARAVVCQSNLKQMQTGWLMFMNQSDGRIPYTYDTGGGFNWYNAMESVYESVPKISGLNKASITVCPGIQNRYPNLKYRSLKWGYAINTLWTGGAGNYNDQKLWNGVLYPANYPWFIDPGVYVITGEYWAGHRVPYALFGEPDWGIGANHADGKIANISFADGSVRPVPIEEIRANLAGPDSYQWLENR